MRQMQSRRFETGDEKMILAACAALLQDLGFTLEESASDLGLVVASNQTAYRLDVNVRGPSRPHTAG